MVECQSFDGYRLKGHYKACPADKQLLLIDGAEHAMSFLVNKEQYILALNQFFKFS